MNPTGNYYGAFRSTYKLLGLGFKGLSSIRNPRLQKLRNFGFRGGGGRNRDPLSRVNAEVSSKSMNPNPKTLILKPFALETPSPRQDFQACRRNRRSSAILSQGVQAEIQG